MYVYVCGDVDGKGDWGNVTSRDFLALNTPFPCDRGAAVPIPDCESYHLFFFFFFFSFLRIIYVVVLVVVAGVNDPANGPGQQHLQLE